MTSAFAFDAFRARFPSLPELTYFNSGSYGLLATTVREAFNVYLDTRDVKGADWGSWVGALEGLRTRMARLLNVDADEVAITGSASAGMNAVATALDFTKKPKVVVSNFEFPTSAQIWHAQERVGARVVHVPESEDGLIPLEYFEKVIDGDTSIVALSQVCYRNGGRIPDDDIRAIAAMAHAHGALVVLDCYQIVGTTPINPRELGVDFCVGGMLKYLLGTAGVGFMYASPDAIARVVPRASGWFAQANFDAMDIFANQPSPTARRFEGGTPPVPNCIAASAGLDIVLDAGLDAIGQQIATTTAYAIDRLREHGIGIGSPAEPVRRGPLVSIPSLDDGALVQALAARGIITSCRDGRLRAGFHAHNGTEDVDILVAALVDQRHLLA